MEYVEINTVSELCDFYGYERPRHPLITIVDLERIDRSGRREGVHYRMGLYLVSCKQFQGELKYGRTTYDFSEGSLMFTAPGQVLVPGPSVAGVRGWGLYIHPDFLNASPRGGGITRLSFFGYDVHEALHVSDAEKKILEDCLQNIKRELAQNLDKHSHDLILANLELFFAYCTRFYERQFLTRSKVSTDVLENFERLLNEYYDGDTAVQTGIPDVKWFGRQLSLSPNYLSDLLKRYTGKSTQEHIHLKMFEKAKAMLWSTEKTVSEIAFELGFEYPSHFTKFFKARTGVAPREYRRQK